ncbi:MAG TPA: metal-dependent hydrolase [Opitutaceae bacterium]
MDPLTHILLGANLSYLAFGRRLGRAAAAVGGLAAFVPDADVFIKSASDPLLAVEYHRGFTHALAFAPVGAAIVAALWLASPAWRSRRWLGLWAAATLAYWSHMLLDAATTYGTQLFWPFSKHRTGWDVIAIIDPPFTLVLLIGLTWATLRQRLRASLVALALCAGYIAWGSVQHGRAVAAQRSIAAARGHTIERHEVMPTLANNIVWRALYIHQGKIYSDRIRVGWLSAPAVRAGWSLPLLQLDGLTPAETARNGREAFQRFAWFSDDWVARSPGDATLLADMRYSLSAEAFDPIWGIRFTPAGAPTDVEWVNRSRNRKVSPAEMWREINGADERYLTVR